MMNNLMVYQDSTLDVASRELDRNLDKRNSIVVPYTSRSGSRDVPPSTKDETSRSKSPLSPSTKDEIMALGYPSNEYISERFCYVLSLNPKYGVPYWVSECLTKDQMMNVICDCRKYSADYFEDQEIDFEGRVTLADYYNSGYDKGHLAAAGNHRYNSQAHESTFCLSNIAPMHKNVNHILSKIENQGRSFAKDYAKVYSITGPVFHRGRELTFLKGGNKVAIPDAFFKVLVYKDKRNEYRIWAYLVENLPEVVHKNIRTARRRLESINRLTGLNIFCKVDKKEIRDDCYPNPRTSRGFGS